VSKIKSYGAFQESTFHWSPEHEVKLFEAIMSNKPAGVAKHFNMALIHYKLIQQGIEET
jgi:hypothetical protein